MDTLKTEDILKRYLDKTSQITKEVGTCFDSVYAALDQISRAAEGSKRKADVETFASFLINSTAQQLIALDNIVKEALRAQLKAELSAPQLLFEFEQKPDKGQAF